MWIPGGGSIETWEWTARMNYVYCYLSYFGYKRGIQVMDGFWKQMESLGVDDNPYRAGFLQLVCVSETDEKAEEEYGPHVDYFYKKCLHVFDGFAEAPGYRTIRTIKSGAVSQVGAAASRVRQKLTWKDFVEEGYVIAGSPKTVVENLRKAVEGLRVGHLMVLLQIGSMPPDLTMKKTELFATQVMPHLKDMWDEYEDNWWPQPIPSDERALAGAATERRS